jgi:hypothetical protein
MYLRSALITFFVSFLTCNGERQLRRRELHPDYVQDWIENFERGLKAGKSKSVAPSSSPSLEPSLSPTLKPTAARSKPKGEKM